MLADVACHDLLSLHLDVQLIALPILTQEGRRRCSLDAIKSFDLLINVRVNAGMRRSFEQVRNLEMRGVLGLATKCALVTHEKRNGLLFIAPSFYTILRLLRQNRVQVKSALHERFLQ